MSIQFDYYYGREAEQFAFYQVPKFLFKDERFKNYPAMPKSCMELCWIECRCL